MLSKIKNSELLQKFTSLSNKIKNKSVRQIINELKGLNGAGSALFKFDNALKSADEIAGVLVNGSYLKNPTAKNVC